MRFGMVVLTNDEVVLVPGTIEKPSPYEASHIALKYILGVQVVHLGRNRQLQLLQLTRRAVIGISNENAQRLCEMLVSKGVPKTNELRWYFPGQQTEPIWVPPYMGH